MGAEGVRRTFPSGHESARGCCNEDCVEFACGVTDKDREGGWNSRGHATLFEQGTCGHAATAQALENVVQGLEDIRAAGRKRARPPRVHPCPKHLKETIGECFHDLRQEKFSETEFERQIDLMYFSAFKSSDLCRFPSSKDTVKMGSRKSHKLDNGSGTHLIARTRCTESTRKPGRHRAEALEKANTGQAGHSGGRKTQRSSSPHQRSGTADYT